MIQNHKGHDWNYSTATIKNNIRFYSYSFNFTQLRIYNILMAKIEIRFLN